MKRCECGNVDPALFEPFSVAASTGPRQGWRCVKCSRYRVKLSRRDQIIGHLLSDEVTG